MMLKYLYIFYIYQLIEKKMPENVKTLKYAFINHEIELVIEDTVYKYLENISKDNLFESLNYIVKEIAGNANKANMKRIHFRRKNLKIESQEDYEEGIKDFQKELNENPDAYFSLAEKLGYYVRVDLFIEKGILVIMIMDNSILIPIEVERIRDKFKHAARFKTMEEVFAEGLDLTEGGGFGIILMILMLRKLGLDEKVIKIMKGKNQTRFELHIPLNLVSAEESEYIADSLVSEIKKIPQFPQHVLELQKILRDENADFSDLAKIIEKDPALIADLLKTANSVMYALPHRVHSIEEAVKLIGFKGIQNLVLTYSTQKLLMNQYRLDVILEIMNHSAEVAFYAYEIAKMHNLKQLMDDIYVGGILHDIGKIMVNALKPKLIEKIKRLCREKGINQDLLENLTNGYNHSIIGGKLAEKWNFPVMITDIIRFHHIPTEASDISFPAAATVNLADTIYYSNRGQVLYPSLNYQVKKFFNLETSESFESILDKLTKKFDRKLENWNN